MKKLGIIGGIGPESTVAYYRLLIKHFRSRYASGQYPELLLHSINMTEMLEFVFNDQLDALVAYLSDKIKVLKAANVDCVALASNTPHLVFDELAASVGIEMISIVTATCNAVAATGAKKVGLLGTKSTMTKGFYQRGAAKLGIEMVIPNEGSQDYVHEKYMGELVFNHISSATKNRLIRIVHQMKSDFGIDGLVLGGTELPLILNQDDFNNLIVFNTTEIHVNAILEKMVS